MVDLGTNMASLRRCLVLLLVITGLLASFSLANQLPPTRWLGCQGETWKAKCENPNQRLRIVRANYGRFSLSVCNPDGVSNWSTKCISHTSLQVLTEKCNGKAACSVEVADKTFGDDPCPETFKYLEVHFDCASESTTSTRSLESFFQPTQAAAVGFQSLVFTITTSSTTMASTSTSTTRAISSATTTTTSPTTQPPITTTAALIDASKRVPASKSDGGSVLRTAGLPGLSQPVSGQATEFCPETLKQAIMWPRTPRGATDFQPCPHQRKSGYVQWTCDNSSPPQWIGSPNFALCASAWIQEIQQKATTDIQPDKLAEEFAQQTKDNAFKFGDDMSGAVSFIEQIVNRGHRAMGRMSSEDGAADPAVKKLGKSLLKAGSNLLDAKHNSSWADLAVEARSETATSLIDSMETIAFMLADDSVVGAIWTSADENIVMAAGKLSMKNQDVTYRFPAYSEKSDIQEKDMGNNIELAASALQKYSRNDVVRIVFLSYKNIGQFLKSVGDDSDRDQLPVNSRILAAAVNDGRRSIDLKEPAVITLEHLTPLAEGARPVCAFWDYRNSKTGFQGSWSTEGCRVLATDRFRTICSCDHLTNFAVLMDVTGTVATSPHNDALTKITYIGCAISIFCLLLTLIVFISFRVLQSERTTIHKNLAFCLMVAEIFFLAGIDQTQLGIGCNIFGAIMHYFFLATFMWSLFEGINLWLLLVEVFDSAKSRRVWFYLAGYGIPLLIVSICLGVDWTSYSTLNYCWLRADNYFILSFVIPVGLIIIANMGFLSVTMYYMCRNHTLQVALHARDAHSWKHVKAWIAGAIGLAIVMSLTWIFGFLYIGKPETIIFAYIFTFLNGFQGVFIFVLVCLRNDKVKSALSQFAVNQRERLSSSLCTSTRSSSSFSDNNNNSKGAGQAFYQTSTPLDKDQHYIGNFGHGYYGQRTADISRRNTTTSTLPPQSPNPISQCTCHDHEKSSTRSSNRDSGHESVSCPSAESPPIQPIHLHQRTSYPTASAARKQHSKVLHSEYPAVAARINAANARRLYGGSALYGLDPNEHIYAEIDPHQLEEEGCTYSDPSDESNTSMTYQRAGSDVSTDDDHVPRMMPVGPCDKHPFRHTGSEHRPLIGSMGRMPLQAKSNPAFRSLSHHGNPLRIRHHSPRQVPFVVPEHQAYINTPSLPMDAVNLPVQFQHGNYNAFGVMSMGDGSQHVRRMPLMSRTSDQPLSYSEC